MFRSAVRVTGLLPLLFLSHARAFSQRKLTAAEVFKRAVPAIVSIDCLGEQGASIGTASGFLVAANGKILTNLHVIRPCHALRIRLSNGDVYDSPYVIEVDAQKDLALIRVNASSMPVLMLGDSKDAEVGQLVYSIGNPFGLQNTLQQGLVSGFRDLPGLRILQVSASINAGNSGGPILDERGRVIGVAAARVLGAENLGFAVPIDYAKGYLKSKTEIPFSTFAATIPKPRLPNAARLGVGGGLGAPPNLAALPRTASPVIANGLTTATGGKLCLDVPKANYKVGAKLEIWDCSGGANQQFIRTDAGELTIGGLCVDAFKGGHLGAEVGLWTCQGSANQKWDWRPDGHSVGEGGFCMAASGNNPVAGTSVVMATCENGNLGQKWIRR